MANLELRRKDDALHGEASLDVAAPHAYSFSFTSSIAEIADFPAFIPDPLKALQLGGKLELDWKGNGTETTFGHLSLPRTWPASSGLPRYSLRGGIRRRLFAGWNVKARQFNLSNQHAAFQRVRHGGKELLPITDASPGFERQTRAAGQRLPSDIARETARAGQLARGLSDDPNFDLDITLDPTDIRNYPLP